MGFLLLSVKYFKKFVQRDQVFRFIKGGFLLFLDLLLRGLTVISKSTSALSERSNPEVSFCVFLRVEHQ